MAVAEANQHTFHLEATDNPGALTKDIQENGMKAGLANKPGATVEYLTPWANQSDRYGLGYDSETWACRAETHERYDAKGSLVEDPAPIFGH